MVPSALHALECARRDSGALNPDNILVDRVEATGAFRIVIAKPLAALS